MVMAFSGPSYAAVNPALELTNQETAYLAEHSVIRFHVEENWAPFNFIEHGEIKGFVNDYVRAISEYSGLPIEFVVGHTREAVIDALKRGEIDVISNIAMTSERREYALFSERSTLNAVQGILTLSHNRSRANLKDIQNHGMTLAVVKGFYHQAVLRKHFPDVQILATRDLKESVRQVLTGKADAAIGAHAVLDYQIAKNFYPNMVSTPIVGSRFFSDSPQYMAVSKNSPALKFILDKAMSLFPEEKLLALRRKWMGTAVADNAKQALLNQSERAYLAQKREVLMCVDPDWMPLEAIRDGKHIGIAADFIQIIAKKLGIPINTVVTKNWDQSVQFAQSRKCDIFSLAMETPNRRAYMDFTRPYLHVPLVVATDQKELFVPDVSAVRDKPLGIVKSYAFAELLKNRYPDLDIVDVESVSDGLRRVERGELFGFIGTLTTVGYELQRNFPELKIAGKFDDSWELGIGVRNDTPLLLTALDKVIASIPLYKNQEILNRWISVKYETNAFAYFWELLAAALLMSVLFAYRHHVLHKYNQKLISLSNTDALTCCANRLKLDEFLAYLVSLYSRHQETFSVILFDLDHFKQVNDKYGHLIGDKVLVEFVNLVEANTRSHDLVGRWGGEEFLIICPNTTAAEATMVAEQLRHKVNDFTFTSVGSLHASFGVAEYARKNVVPEELLSHADKALYFAKENGRNRVVSYSTIEGNDSGPN